MFIIDHPSIKKLRQYINAPTKRRYQINPNLFHDDVALKTGWNFIIAMGFENPVHKVKKISDSRIEIVPRIEIQIILGLVTGIIATVSFVFFLFLLMFFINVLLHHEKSFEPLLGLGYLVGFCFFAFLFRGFRYLIKKLKIPKVFDKITGFYWHGNNSNNSTMAMNKLLQHCKLKEIHALQLLPKPYLRSQRCELNLVLCDGHRINIMDEAYYHNVLKSAEMIAEFLGIPVWDAKKNGTGW